MATNQDELTNKHNILISAGAIGKELFLMRAEEAFNAGNEAASIFYQVRALVPKLHARFSKSSNKLLDTHDILEELKSLRTQMPKNMAQQQHPSCEHIAKHLTKLCTNDKETEEEVSFDSILERCSEPAKGFTQITNTCEQFPWQWTILQLTKGFYPGATCSTYRKIDSCGKAIYLTLLRHCRSDAYAAPICVRINVSDSLFECYSRLAELFKACVTVEAKTMGKEEKDKYWRTLEEFNKSLENSLEVFRNAIKPWHFLFTGIPKGKTSANNNNTFAQIDAFCQQWQLKHKQLVLLSLAVLQVDAISEQEVSCICSQIIDATAAQVAATALLLNLKKQRNAKLPAAGDEFTPRHYPCILIVDELLDHFFWEELNVQQEFTRSSSLSSLHSLYKWHESKISNGYVKLNISNGCSVVNPDKNLKKLEMRMKSFFQYWLPDWQTMCSEKPTQEQLFNDFFKRSCYVYSGHGSGLQFIGGKYIAQQRIDAVVLLFGCDSVRLFSHGLYSELVGAHLYYEIAKCPALVGSLLPALDVNMDTVEVEIITRWIRPNAENIVSWQSIDAKTWKKTGVIKPAANAVAQTVAQTKQLFTGSLCALIARVHQRVFEPKAYNTVAYVCRGLPVWNCDIFPEPN